jgi:CubicO group peptidase (beta-lactamase class C family)
MFIDDHSLFLNMKIFYFTLLVVVLASCADKEKSLSPLAASIDSVVQAVTDTARFNGNILVAKDGKVVYQKSVGYANYYTQEKLNDSAVFELASVSKQFTATAIMLLKERGELSYEDDVRKYIPELPYEGMTIRHFLTHTSGIPDYMDQFNKNWDPNTIAFNIDIVKQLSKNMPPVYFQPGEKWEYSNTAYALLAVIIERVSGKSYGAFLQENLFAPAGMHHTRTYNTRRSKNEVIPNYAYGFVFSDSLHRFVLPDSLPEYHFVYTLDGIEGDGIVNSTTGDLFKWDQVLYTDKIISQTTLQEAFEPVKLKGDSTYPYGFGWAIQQSPSTGKMVLHGGSWPGYGTYFIRFIERKDCIIILTNNDGLALKTLTKEITKRLNKVKA